MPKQPFYIGAYTTCDGFKDGADQYSRIPLNPKNSFCAGNDVSFFFEIRDISVKFRLKVNIYKNGVLSWTWGNDEWQNKNNELWKYAYALPVQATAPEGKYEFRVMLDIGSGYSEVGTAECSVMPKPSLEGGPDDGSNPDKKRYTYMGATICGGIADGTEEWQRVAVEPKNNFKTGDNIYCLVSFMNVSTKYNLKIDVFKDGKFSWKWGDAGFANMNADNWKYVYGEVLQNNAQPGIYKFQVSIDTGNGFTMVDSISCSVGKSTTINRDFLTTKSPSVCFSGQSAKICGVNKPSVNVDFYSLSGKLVFRTVIYSSGKNISIRLYDFPVPNGIYYCDIAADNYHFNKVFFLRR